MEELAIDLNADLGELPEAVANGSDFELMRHISSANVACGGHAGDTQTMERTVAAAKQLGVTVGAHPGYPDRQNFGRVELPLSPPEIEATVREQMMALGNIVRAQGLALAHVKPHGALYHAANHHRDVARAIASAVLAIDPKLVMVEQAGAVSLALWRDMGLRCAGEAFADRVYEPDGSLRKRTLPGAVHENAERAARQAVDIAVRHSVVARNGSALPLTAETICIHSDTPGAAAIAVAVRDELARAGVTIRSLAKDSETV